ncbi:MAG TPA: hypothetical protein DIT85_10670 [Pantoea ananatis]|nr:hypothetical protein B9Q16_06655 [Pantoea ananatis]PKC41579.1 hypothetical protein V461_15870 [Pantoea ananatis BRT98]PQK72887.1 hypothetical protein CG427_14535 [Pantoea ananatis]PQK79209.1 hypothetical protein CG428_06195 [Pantoea ananatis]PQK90442.1 hypothetical protein CG432_09205 [Pantoea ananatis]
MVKLTFLLAVIVMTAAGIVVFMFRQDSVHCIANINYIRGGETFSVIASHDMRNGQGIIAITGRLTDSAHKVISLSKIIRFTYQREGNLYLARSTLIEPSPDNQMSLEEQQKWLPAFFISVGATFPFVIKRTGLQTWVFYSGPVPLYLCEK